MSLIVKIEETDEVVLAQLEACGLCINRVTKKELSKYYDQLKEENDIIFIED